MRTPDQVLDEIRVARAGLAKGADALHGAELAAERADDAAQMALDKALLVAEGSIPEKQAHARLQSAEERDAAFIKRAEFNRVKTKIRTLETTLMTLQAELKWMREEGA